MKQLTPEVFHQIRRFVLRFARPVELAWWSFLFENGSSDGVVAALRAYQNADGGFGNGLEPDCANPASTPAATVLAYSRLRAVGRDGRDEPMIRDIMRYVEHSEHFTEHGWLWSIPSNNGFPCQPWYRYPNAPWFPEDWPPENYVNGGLLSFILRYFDRDSEIVRKALRVIEFRLPLLERFAEFCTFTGEWNQESIEANDWVDLLEAVERHRLRSPEECARLKTRFLEIAKRSAIGPVYAEAERRLTGRGYTEAELDAAADRLSENRLWSGGLVYYAAGGERFDAADGTSRPMHIGEVWWELIGAIGALRLLAEHGRLSAEVLPV